MATDRTTTLFERLRQCSLLDEDRLDELASLPESQDPDPRALGRTLLRRGWLTRFQINQVAQGRGKDLNVGPYQILDRLGEGGMGQVFQARHQHMQRIVALKVIRKEKLANEDAVKRFYQEIQAAAQLHHPNIVVAYDAGPAGNTHYFAMEFVEGTDLAAHVHYSGPLGSGQACQYIRQAALGLQHAFERGLVHRDIKPANLLLGQEASGTPVVKLLDLGLARLQTPGGAAEKGLTRTGQVMGTPDYLAPEQAMDSRSADVRSDLYSLGCTFYFLLTGHPPFSGESLAQVLLKHQVAEVEPPANGWGAIPTGVQAILRKLLAKKPEDRFQTPQELVDALAPFRGMAESAPPVPQPSSRDTGSEVVWPTLSGESGIITAPKLTRRKPGDSTERMATTQETPATKAPHGNRALLLIAGGIGVGALLVLAIVSLVLVLGRAPAPPTASVVAQAEPEIAPAPGVDTPEAVPPAIPLEPLSQLANEPAPDTTRNSSKQLAKTNGPERPTSKPNPDTSMDVPPGPPAVPMPGKAAPVAPVVPARPEPQPAPQPAGEPKIPVTPQTRLISELTSRGRASVAMSPDGHFGWYQSQYPMLIDLRKDTPATRFPAASVLIQALAFTPDNNRAVTCNGERTVRMWGVPEGTLIRAFDATHAVQSVVVSPNGKWIAANYLMAEPGSGGANSRVVESGITVWQLETGRKVRTFRCSGDLNNRIVFSPDSNRIYAKPYADREASVYVFDVNTGVTLPKVRLPDGRAGNNGMLVSPDGNCLLLSNTLGLVLWDMGTQAQRQLFALPRRFGRPLAWCASHYLLSTDVRSPFSVDERIRGQAAWDPDNSNILVWDTETGKVVRSLKGNVRPPTSAAVSADGRSVLSGCSDGSVRYWELPRDMVEESDKK
jgi:serine/threonine protein kinase